MRRGFGGGIRRMDNGHIESVNMGADYTAEHEWGIQDLERDFGLNRAATPGVPRRTITRLPNGMVFDPAECVIGYTGHSWDRNPALNDYALREIAFHQPFGSQREDESQGAWSGSDFAVRFRKTQQGKQDVRDLWEAFQRHDIAFLFQNVGNNPFARAGLNLVIVSRLPQDIVEMLRQMDEDNDRLLAAALATGIQQRLDAAAHRGTARYQHLAAGAYYALRPRWADETKQSVVFFLNPGNQQDYQSGWYTAEELDAWLRGEGPVVKARVQP